MRLFFALNPDDPFRGALLSLMEDLRPHMERARFTPPERLHLTVAFLGETSPSHLSALGRIADKAFSGPLTLTLTRPGRFTHRDGDVFWAGIEPNGELAGLHKRLTAQLRGAGFSPAEGAFSPHITLCRGKARDGFDAKAYEARPLQGCCLISHLDLMESLHVQGKLVYREILRSPGRV